MKPFISDMVIRSFQKKYYSAYGGQPNTWEPLAISQEISLDSGVVICNEVQFSKNYPNSFADIYYQNDDFTVKRPTIVYLHGGGFFMGSRTSGDPLASAGGSVAKKGIMLAQQGFNVVSMDYCLSPDCRYPAQIIQIDEGLSFFRNHAQQYHLDMENVVLMGGSAGAVISAILGAVYSNPDYANRLGVTPSMELAAIKGLCIDGAPMNMNILNWGTVTMFRSWYGQHSRNCKAAKEIHVCDWVTQWYPKAFLTAGSEGCYYEHVRELGVAMKAKGVEADEFYIDPNESKQGHGYMDAWETDPYAKMGMDRQIAFIKRVTA